MDGIAEWSIWSGWYGCRSSDCFSSQIKSNKGIMGLPWDQHNAINKEGLNQGYFFMLLVLYYYSK